MTALRHGFWQAAKLEDYFVVTSGGHLPYPEQLYVEEG